MKRILLPVLTLFASCAVTDYYQVYQTDPEMGVVTENNVVFEDANCTVYYNLWNEGGNMGFQIYNKTENDLTVYLTKTFFVLNGVAYEYFQNRIYSKSTNTGTTVSSYYPYYYSVAQAGSSTSYSTSFIEKPVLTIPPKTLINISEFNVTDSRYVHCDLYKYPSRKDIPSVKYSMDTSPFVFYNLITYSTGSDTLRLENRFYVSEITNYPSTEMFTDVDTSECGTKLFVPVEVFKNANPDKFYVKYSRER